MVEADEDREFVWGGASRREQVRRFAVGAPDGGRSRTWRLWVPPGKSDVYISGRSLGSDVKVSLHEPGPSRFALTREHLRRPDALQMPADNPRGVVEWQRARPQLPDVPMVRPFGILVPWTEVNLRDSTESGAVAWTPAPGEGMCVEYGIFYAAAGLTVVGHPGRRSMGTQLIGKVDLADGEQVFVVAWEHEMDERGLAELDRLRSVKVLDAAGTPMADIGMLAFGVEEIDGANVGVFMDVSAGSDD